MISNHLFFQPSICFDVSNFSITMTFSKIYGNIILPFIEQYKDAKNDKARNVVIANAVDAVKKSRETLEDKGVDLPKDLQHVCLFFHSLFFSTMFMTSGHHPIYKRVYKERCNCPRG